VRSARTEGVLIHWEELHSAVLVGHSYAGYVVSGAAEQIAGEFKAVANLDETVTRLAGKPGWRVATLTCGHRRDGR
jgi:hypothetical protein